MKDTITKRLDQVQKLSGEYLSENPPAPRSVKIELSPRCNYRCAFCGILSREKQPKEDMELDFFKKITRDMMDSGVEEIGPFLIGEPFLNPDLHVEAIRYLKSELRVPYVFLTSNASLAFPDRVEAYMQAGLDSLKWSCNSATPEQFISLTGMPSDLFDWVNENIKMARKIRDDGGFKTRLYASSIHFNESQPWEMKTMLDENILPYVDEHYWLPLYSMGGMATKREAELGYKPIGGNTGRYDAPVDPIPCWPLFTVGHVLFDGRLTACCSDPTGDWVVGDLRTQSFMEAWNSMKFIELRTAHLRGNILGSKCEKCVLY